MMLTLAPMGAFGLEVGAYEVEYHSPEEMASDSGSDYVSGNDETDNAASEDVTEEMPSDEYAEDATEEAPSNGYEEDAVEEAPSNEYEEDATEEEPSDDEDEEKKEIDFNNISGGDAIEVPVFFTFYPEELVVQSHVLFNASVEELNAILLQGVNAVDEFGNQLEVTVQSDSGLAAYIADPDAFEDNLYLDIASWQITYAVDFNGMGIVSETRNLHVEFAQIMATSTQHAVANLAQLREFLPGGISNGLINNGDTILIANQITIPPTQTLDLDFGGDNVTFLVSGNHRHFRVEGTLSLGDGVTLQGHRPLDINILDIQSNNPSWPLGGGVVIAGGTTFNMNSGTIRGNFASSGGAVQILNGIFIMSGTAMIEDNHAGFGGGVHSGNGAFVMDGGTIQYNVANNGGGVFGNIVMNNGTINDNRAWNANGGGIWSNSVVTIHNGSITNNFSHVGGGGIRMSGGTLTINGGTISDNMATYGGSLINVLEAVTVTIADSALGSLSGNIGQHGPWGIRYSFLGSDDVVYTTHRYFVAERDDITGTITITDTRGIGGTITLPSGETITTPPGGATVTTPGSGGTGTVDVLNPGESDPITVPEGSTVLPNPDSNTGGAIVIPPGGGNPVEIPLGGSLGTDGIPRDADGNELFIVTFLNYDTAFIQTSSVLSGSNATPPATNPTRVGWDFNNWSHAYTNVQSNLDIIAIFAQSNPDGSIDVELPNNGGTVTVPPGSTVTYPNDDGNVDVELPNNGGTVSVPPGSTVTEPDEDGNISVTPPGSDRPVTVPPGSDVGLPDEDGNIPVTPPGSNESTPVPPGGSINENGNVQDEDGASWPPEQPQTPAPPELEITTQPQATGTNLINGIATVTQGQISGNLSITATTTENATLTYQWYRNNTAITDATTASILIPTDLALGLHHFHVVVTATINPSVSVTSNIIAINVVVPTSGGITPPSGNGSSGSGDDSGNNSDGNDGNSGSGIGNQPGTNQPGATTPDNNLPDAGQSNDNNQGNNETANDTANQAANNAWADLNDTITPGGNVSTATPNPITSDNALIQFDDMWIELDDTGVPLGAWTWDEAQDMWIFDENVPLAAFDALGAVATVAGVTAVTSQVAEAVALMPQTDVESNAMQFALLFALAMIIAVASLVVIKYETKKRIK